MRTTAESPSTRSAQSYTLDMAGIASAGSGSGSGSGGRGGDGSAGSLSGGSGSGRSLIIATHRVSTDLHTRLACGELALKATPGAMCQTGLRRALQAISQDIQLLGKPADQLIVASRMRHWLPLYNDTGVLHEGHADARDRCEVTELRSDHRALQPLIGPCRRKVPAIGPN